MLKQTKICYSNLHIIIFIIFNAACYNIRNSTISHRLLKFCIFRLNLKNVYWTPHYGKVTSNIHQIIKTLNIKNLVKTNYKREANIEYRWRIRAFSCSTHRIWWNHFSIITIFVVEHNFKYRTRLNYGHHHTNWHYKLHKYCISKFEVSTYRIKKCKIARNINNPPGTLAETLIFNIDF